MAEQDQLEAEDPEKDVLATVVTKMKSVLQDKDASSSEVKKDLRKLAKSLEFLESSKKTG